jgi:hypothetical protein
MYKKILNDPNLPNTDPAHAMAICADRAPGDFDVAPGHAAACWLHAKDLDPAQAGPIARPPAGQPPAGQPDSARSSAPEPGEETR